MAFYKNSGIADLMPSWDALNEAKKAVLVDERMKSLDAVDAVNNIASYWENNMLSIWKGMMLNHPTIALEIANRAHGHLTTGIFAVARNGSVAYQWTLIILDDGKPRIWRPNLDCQHWPCVAGMIDIATKYMKSDTEFMTAYPSTTKSWGYELLRVIRLVDLTIAEDPSGTVHGPIDALDLSNNGTIRWRQKKANCPESQD
jgi:hypothetical protein